MGAVDNATTTPMKEITMKRNTRMIVAALTILGVSAGGLAHARGDGPCGGPQAMSGKAAGEYMSKRLDRLQTELKLSPEQETAWQAWRGDMKEKMTKMRERRPDSAALAKLPAPERMAQMLERHKERQQEMEAGLTSLRAFYAKLSPEQQKTFDSFKPFGDHRRDGPRRAPKEGSGRG